MFQLSTKNTKRAVSLPVSTAFAFLWSFALLISSCSHKLAPSFFCLRQVSIQHCKAAASTLVCLRASYASPRLSLLILLTEVSAKLTKSTWFLSELGFSNGEYPPTATVSQTTNSAPPGTTCPSPNPTEPLSRAHGTRQSSQQGSGAPGSAVCICASSRLPNASITRSCCPASV